MQQITSQHIKELKELVTQISNDIELITTVDEVVELVVNCYRKGNKTAFCGNGGSAAQAQHLAAELSGKFNLDREPIPSEACHVNSSFITAVANDYDFTNIYKRYVKAFLTAGDILIGLSTSGNSKNVIEAFKQARENQIYTVALTGESGGDLKNYSDFIIGVPSTSVPRIQEVHQLIGHSICEQVEKQLFS